MKQIYQLNVSPPGSDNNPTGDFTICCPICGFLNVHPLPEVGSIATTEPYGAHPRVKGIVVVIPMWCENQCRFNLIFGEHKGFLQVWAEKRDRLPGDPRFDGDPPAEYDPPPETDF